LSTTPTVEIATKKEGAAGGIIITASHNPKEWNALKLLNGEGEFISAAIGEEVLKRAEEMDFTYASVEKLGQHLTDDSYLQKHIDLVLNYPLVNIKNIQKHGFKVVVDCINSTGALVVPQLLKALGVEDVIVLNGEVDGKFAHKTMSANITFAKIYSWRKKNGIKTGLILLTTINFTLTAMMMKHRNLLNDSLRNYNP
jgi:phosphomannomutase